MGKIVFIISGKSPITLTGGLGAYSWNIGKIFKSLGYDVRIFGYSDKDEVIENEFAKIYHVKSPTSKMLVVGLPLTARLLANKMKEVIIKEKLGSVIIYESGCWGISGIYLKRVLKNYDIILNMLVGYFSTYKHDQWGQVQGASIKDYGLFSYLTMYFLYLLFISTYSRLESKLISEVDYIIVHYDSTERILKNEFKSFGSGVIKKIPYYIDLYSRHSITKFSKPFKNYDGLIIGVICRQDPRKGINTFIKALKILTDRRVDYRCIIAGDGIYLNKNIKLAYKFGIKDNISFLGFVESVEPYLKSSDIYVLPTLEEGSGAISLLEAMKVGLPIVTTYCDGIPEDFVDGETALLVPTKNAEALADAIEKLIKEPELRKKLSENVKEDYKKRFTFDKMREGIKNILLELERECNNING